MSFPKFYTLIFTVLSAFYLFIFPAQSFSEEDKTSAPDTEEVLDPNQESHVNTQKPEKEDTLKPSEKIEETKEEKEEKEKRIRDAFNKVVEETAKGLGVPITIDPDIPLAEAIKAKIAIDQRIGNFASLFIKTNELPDNVVNQIIQNSPQFSSGKLQTASDQVKLAVIGGMPLSWNTRYIFPNGIHYVSSDKTSIKKVYGDRLIIGVGK